MRFITHHQSQFLSMSNGQQMLLIWLHTEITNLGLSWQPAFSPCKIQSWQCKTGLTTDLNVPVFNFCFISFLTDSPAPSAAPKLRVIILLEKLNILQHTDFTRQDQGRVGGCNLIQIYQSSSFLVDEASIADWISFHQNISTFSSSWKLFPALPALVWSGHAPSFH